MPALSRLAAPGPEQPLLTRPRRDTAVTAVAAVLTVTVFAAVAQHGLRTGVQRLDDAWLRLMISGRAPPFTAIAKAFNLIGLVYVTLPVRIVLAGLLAVRRQWWRLAAFATAVMLSEVLIGLLKGLYDRARPPGSLVATSGQSFPSGHAIAASVTVAAAVIVLVPAGRRVPWGVAAALFSVLMGLSRAYLGAHWLSDAVAGILLGISCALLPALVLGHFQQRQSERGPGSEAPPRPARLAARHRAGGRRGRA